MGNASAAQERAAELNRQFEEVNRAAEILASEESRATTERLDRALEDLEGALGLLEDGAGEVGEQTTAALERVRETQGLLGEVREAQAGGADEISAGPGSRS